MLPDFLSKPEWLAVILAVLALMRQEIVGLGCWLWRRWQIRYIPTNTQVHKDRDNYSLLLQKYEGYLTILENLIVLRSQVEAGSDPWTPELEQQFVQTSDSIYDSLEKRSDHEEHMGVFQLLNVLEGRMVGIAEERRKRADLQTRQAEIESHPLFIGRSSVTSVN